jgi:predicted MFS family arabinose efflux permease
MIAWVTSMLFLPGTLVKTFDISPNMLTICFASIGLLWSLSNFLINRLLAKTLSTYRILIFSLLLLSAALFAIILPVNLPGFLFLMGVAVFGAALSWTNTLVAVSISASEEIQGKTLGINQSIGAVAAVIGPSLGGLLASVDPQNVFLFTASCSLLAAAIFKSGWSKTTSLV